MEFIIAYFKGWILSFRRIGMWLLLFFFNFVFAVLASLPVMNLLESKLANSLAIEKLLPRFDFTVFSDMMNQYGESVMVLLDQSRFLVLLFFIFSIFLSGGILNAFKRSEEGFSFRMFWSGCMRYFWRLLRLTVYFLIIHIGIMSLFYHLFFLHVGGNIGDLDSELVLYQYLRLWVPLYVIVASIFFMIHDYTKVHMVHEDKRWLTLPFWQSFGLVFRHFLSTFSLYWLNLFTFLAVGYVYFLLNRPADSSSGICYTFLIGQAFVFARIGTKLLNLASATVFYKNQMRREKKIILATEKEVIVESEREENN